MAIYIIISSVEEIQQMLFVRNKMQNNKWQELVQKIKTLRYFYDSDKEMWFEENGEKYDIIDLGYAEGPSDSCSGKEEILIDIESGSMVFTKDDLYSTVKKEINKIKLKDNVLDRHVYVFNQHDNSGEQLSLDTEFHWNGDPIDENNGVFTNQELTLQSYGNLASINLCGISITP